MDDSHIKNDLKRVLNEALESINADQSIKDVFINWDDNIVTFSFDLVEIDGEYSFYSW